MSGYSPGALREDQPPGYVLLEDNASVHNSVADEILKLNDALLLELPPYSPNLPSIEPTFADYKRNVRDLTYHHPE